VPEQRTENDLLRKRLYSKANCATEIAWSKRYGEEFQRYYQEERLGGICPARYAWRTAMKRLKEGREEEFAFERTMRHAKLLQEAGYQPAPRGGFATGRYARRRVDTSDTSQENET
jgi:hypothetical protein